MEENIINNTQFDLINSKEERKCLAENLNNFSILNLNNLSDKDNYIVKGASELLKAAILSSESSKLFKSKSPLIDSEETNNYIYANVFKYLILKMNEKLELIIDKLGTCKILTLQTKEEKISEIRDKISNIVSIIYGLKEEIRNNNFELKELNTLKEKTQDLNDYCISKYDYFLKIPAIMKSFSFTDTIAHIALLRREKLFDNSLKEFYLINNLYELSLETLIYINIALCSYYIKISNFKESDNIINEMFDSNSSFNEDIRKLKAIQEKISSYFGGTCIIGPYGMMLDSLYKSCYDFETENIKIWLRKKAYFEDNFCCYIELLRDIKNIMSEEIYILEINNIKYLIFKNNYKQI